MAASIGRSARGIPSTWRPDTSARARGRRPGRPLVLAAIERDANTVSDYDIDRATRLATIKLIGYSEVSTRWAGLAPDASVVLFGGRAKDQPYPGRPRSRP